MGLVNGRVPEQLAVLGLSAAVLAGCMVHRGGPAGVSSRVLGESTRTQTTGGAVVRVAQDGTYLALEATEECETVRERRVEQTTHYGREIASPGLLVGIGALGVGSGVMGGLLVGNVFDFPPMASMSPTDDGFSLETAALLGGLLLVGSATLVTVLLANLFGVAGTDDEVAHQTESLGLTGPAAACVPPTPSRDAEVRLRGPNGGALLGRTDANGRLGVQLERVVEPRFVYDHPGRTAAIAFGGVTTQHELDLDPLRVLLDEQVWARANAPQCAAAQASRDCDGVASYIRLFPGGAHASAANQTLATARARLAERAERLEQERAAEAQRRAEEEARWRAEQEARQRAERERWERQQREYEQQAEQRRAQADAERERRARQADCRRTCSGTCGGQPACVSACVQQQCH